MAFAPAQRNVAARRSSIYLADALLSTFVVFVPAILAVAAVVVVIKQVHTVVQITEERAQLQKIALGSYESAFVNSATKSIVTIGLAVIVLSFLGVTVLNQRETKSSRLRLIAGDVISEKWLRSRFALFVEKKVKISAVIRRAVFFVRLPLRTVTASAQKW